MGTGKNPIDSFFKESLQDHTVRPSDEKKAAFLSEISASGTGRSSNKWIFLLPLVLLFVIGGGYGLYSILGTSETAPYSSAPAGHPETAVSAGTIDKTTEKGEVINKTETVTGSVEKDTRILLKVTAQSLQRIKQPSRQQNPETFPQENRWQKTVQHPSAEMLCRNHSQADFR